LPVGIRTPMPEGKMAEMRSEVEAYLKRLIAILEEDVAFEIEEEPPDGLYVNLVLGVRSDGGRGRTRRSSLTSTVRSSGGGRS